MSYNEMTIKEVVSCIEDRKLFLPAIQRKFVWNEEQIANLFDSLLKGYPIGTFLFWEINKSREDIDGYYFYDFIKNYHERDRFQNELVDKIIKDEFFVALDGQQRLTSIYISLAGSLQVKEPYKQWTNNDAFPKKELYLNLKETKDEDDELKYEFKFVKSSDSILFDGHWIKVKDILDFSDSTKVMFKYVELGFSEIEVQLITKLWDVLSKDKLISFFKVEGKSMDEVLDIFVRVNSAGTVLSKSDLIFSTLVSTWNKGREKIDDLIKLINRPTQKFKFNNDFIMRSVLYLSELSIALKVNSFKNSINHIIESWSLIEKSIKQAVIILECSGFTNDNINSYNALIPFIYFIYKGGSIKNCEQEFKKYFIISQTKNLFGVASNAALTETRKAMQVYLTNNKIFTNDIFKDVRLVGNRTFIINKEDLEQIFNHYKKGHHTYNILLLLYPEIKTDLKQLHQDHVHPISFFTDKNLSKIFTDEEEIKWMIDNANSIANLQLLEGLENESKNNKKLEVWIIGNSIKFDPEISYSINDFKAFYEKRKQLMWNELCKVFGVNDLHIKNIQSS